MEKWPVINRIIKKTFLDVLRQGEINLANPILVTLKQIAEVQKLSKEKYKSYQKNGWSNTNRGPKAFLETKFPKVG